MAAPASDQLMRAAVADPQRALRELARLDAQDSLSDYGALVWPVVEPRRKLIRGHSWDAICRHLEAVHYGQLRHLVVNVPPGFSKSMLFGVMFPTWEWGPRDRPDLRYLTFSYNDKLTIRDNRRARSIVTNPLYQGLWGDRFYLVSDQNAKVRFDTNHTGWRMASSIGGTGTGERGDRLIIDDPNNVKDVESDAKREEALLWFAEVLPTRLNDPEQSAILVIQQRTHESDVTGLILREELGYEWLCLPMEFEAKNRSFTSVPVPGVEPERVRRIKVEDEAIPRWISADDPIPDGASSVGPVRELFCQDWRQEEGELLEPDRFTRRHLEEELKPQLRSVGGSYAEAGQLQQRPTPRSGGMFQRSDFNFLEASELPAGLLPARGYDLAASERKTSPYSAGVKVAVEHETGRVFVLHAEKIQGKPGTVERWMQSLAKGDGADVAIDFPQDPAQAGKWQRAYLAGRLQGYRVHSSPENGDKVARARPFAAQCENGNVYLVRAPWNDGFIGELVRFPRGDFKDYVDAVSRGYARALKLKPRRVGAGPKVFAGGR